MQQVQWASAQQREFVEASPDDVVCFLGGFGCAKTYGGLIKLLKLCDDFPGSRAAIVRRQSNQLHATTLQTFWGMLPAEAYVRRNDQSGFVDLRNGSRIWFLHLDSPESLAVLHGLELNFAFVDEGFEIDEGAWDLLDSRIGRWSHATKRGGWPTDWKYRDQAGNPFPPRVLFMATNSPGYESWIFRRWADESPERERWKDSRYRLITAPSDSNRFLSEANLKNLRSHDPEWIRRYVDASWGASEGMVHQVSNLSLLDPTADLLDMLTGGSCRLHRTFDYGLSSPTACVWWAIDKDGNHYAYRSYQEGGLLIRQHRELITKLSPATEHYLSNLMDPSAFAKTAQKAGGKWSMADEFGDTIDLPQQTAIFLSPADNNEEVSRSRINEALWVDPDHKHPISHQAGAPRLYFLRTTTNYPHGCTPVIQDVKAQKLKPIGIANQKTLYGDERDPGVPDHLYDCVRYYCNAHAIRPHVKKYDPYKDPNTFVGYARISKKDREERRRLTEDWGTY